jgi:hypothetical protein
MAMFPPLYTTCAADAGVKAIFGNSPRIYPHGMAPAAGSNGFATPYAVHQVITGSPENYLAGLPDADGWTEQVDVYASTATAAASAAEAIRDALEPIAYVSAWRGQFKDPDTELYRFSFDVDFITPR